MRKLKLRIGKWAFSYLDVLIILVVTIVILVLSLPSWSILIAPILVLVIKPILDSQRGKKEEMTKVAESIDRLSTEFSKFTGGFWGCSIRSISKDFISKHGNNEKIKGWEAYFDQDRGIPGLLFEAYGSFERKVREYIGSPKGKEGLSVLIREFLDLVGLHYKMHANFLEMIRDVGDGEFGQRYNEFKKEYDEFYRGLRGIAHDLKKVASMDLEGKFYYDFAKDFPIEIIDGGMLGEGV